VQLESQSVSRYVFEAKISGCLGCEVVLMMSGATIQNDGGEPIDGNPPI
jgi:hypothetical protein